MFGTEPGQRVAWMDHDLANALPREKGILAGEAIETMRLMIDAGYLAYQGEHGSIRISLKGAWSRRPFREQFKNYMFENHLAIVSLVFAAIGTLTGIGGLVLSIIALIRGN